MSIYLALDKKTNDLFKEAGTGVKRVSDGRFVVQQVQCKLKTYLGEWLLDPSIGFLNFDDFDRNYDLWDIESRAREIILNTQGVEEIDTMTLDYSDRVLTINFTARTIYGEIDTTVKWDNT